jgi:hypothetical protein
MDLATFSAEDGNKSSIQNAVFCSEKLSDGKHPEPQQH